LVTFHLKCIAAWVDEEQPKLRKEVDQMAEFEIYEDQNNPGEFRWRLRANNNEIIADSGESYRDKDDCEHGIELVQTQSPSATLQDLT